MGRGDLKGHGSFDTVRLAGNGQALICELADIVGPVHLGNRIDQSNHRSPPNPLNWDDVPYLELLQPLFPEVPQYAGDLQTFLAHVLS